jgi:hypothetical protein
MKDLSPEARQLLEVARTGDSPSTEDRARVRRALAATLEAGGASASASAAAATKAALGGGAKGGVALWLALGAASGVVTSAIVFIAVPAWKANTVEGARRDFARSGAAPAPSTRSTSPVAASGVATTERRAAGDGPAPESTTSFVPSGPAPEATMSLAAKQPAPATDIAAQGSPHKNKRGPEGSSTETTARAAQTEGAAEPEAANGEAPVAASPSSALSSLGAETTLLQDARAALDRGDAAGALALLDEHEREFPLGVLTEERLATRVFALCSLGRQAEAQGVAERLLRHAPSSPLRARVLQSCAGSR